MLGLLSADAVAGLSLVSDVALGFIAFSIGSEFKPVSYTHLDVYKRQPEYEACTQGDDGNAEKNAAEKTGERAQYGRKRAAGRI